MSVKGGKKLGRRRKVAMVYYMIFLGIVFIFIVM